VVYYKAVSEDILMAYPENDHKEEMVDKARLGRLASSMDGQLHMGGGVEKEEEANGENTEMHLGIVD
jgi:hypothetical protein